jgi:hypothetical protein
MPQQQDQQQTKPGVPTEKISSPEDSKQLPVKHEEPKPKETENGEKQPQQMKSEPPVDLSNKQQPLEDTNIPGIDCIKRFDL